MSQVIQVICGPTLVREVSDLLRACEVRGYYRSDGMQSMDLAAEGGLTSMSRSIRLSSLTIVLPDAQAQGVLEGLRNLRRAQKHPGALRVITWAADVL